MRQAQTQTQKILGFFKRRKGYFFLSFILVIVISSIGAYILPEKYEASTTILVQREEIMIPLIQLTGDFAMSTDDRFGTFNEITYSSAAMQTLIDSLGLGSSIRNEDDREEVIKRLKKNIRTEKPGESTYRILFYNSDPVIAKRGDLVLSQFFIQTILQVENKRNEVTLDFFQSKLDEFKEKYAVKETSMVSLAQARVQEMPAQNGAMAADVAEIDKQTPDIIQKMREERHALDLFNQFSPTLTTDHDKELISNVQVLDIPHSTELQPLVAAYTALSRKYTPKHPDVRKSIRQIQDLLGIMKTALVQDTMKQAQQLADLSAKREKLINAMKQKKTIQEEEKGDQADFDIARKLMSEMEVKVEQARQTRDLGNKGSEQFIIIDPPLVPAEPTQPDRLYMILNGIGLGVLMGLFSAGCKELLDPTIRTIQDIGVFQKGIIAFIPEKTIEED